MYRRQLRLSNYFEIVYANELDYLRDRCRELEETVASFSSGPESPFQARFPKPDFRKEDLTTFSSSGNDSYLKEYQTKNRWAGLTADQAFYLEVECLRRLDDIRKLNKFDHFPFPIIFEASEPNLTLRMSYCG